MVPENLPTGDATIIGYANAAIAAVTPDRAAKAARADESAAQELEDFAHTHKALLSSDAMRHILSVCPKGISRTAFLQKVIGRAKVSFPSEDGWVVVNLERMESLCDECMSETTLGSAPTTAGSLAEAMVRGDVPTAFELIGGRPMVALADAAADFDALYRQKQGETVLVSEMLTREAEGVSAEQVKAAIDALTAALDGTYASEEEAVRMAILKAVKTLA